MANPRCPRCRKGLAYPHSAKFLNPWSCKCPHCAAALEMSAPWKLACAGAIGLAAALAWLATDEIVALAFWGVVALLPVHRASWQLMRLRLKEERLSDAEKTGRSAA